MVAALAAVACGQEVTRSSTDPVLLVHDSDGGMDAFVVGRLRYLLGPKCFVIESASDATVRVIPVFPGRSRPVVREGSVVAVDVPKFGEVPVNALVRAGGGHAPADMKFPEQPAECSSTSTPFLIDRVEVTQ
jgi:hypothetical protein